jgi:hypothetical protein
MWIIILIFILIYYLNSLWLERDTEVVDEVIYTFEYCGIYESVLYLYSESVMFYSKLYKYKCKRILTAIVIS